MQTRRKAGIGPRNRSRTISFGTHGINEFRQFSGSSPQAFLERYGTHRNYIPLDHLGG